MKCFSLFILNRWLSWDCSDASLPIFIFIFHSARSVGTTIGVWLRGKSKSNQFWFGIRLHEHSIAIVRQLFTTRPKDVFDTLRVFFVCSPNNFIHYFFSLQWKCQKNTISTVTKAVLRRFRIPQKSQPREKSLAHSLRLFVFVSQGRQSKNLGYY